MPDFMLVRVLNPQINGDRLEADLSIDASWSVTYAEHLGAPGSTTTPAQAIAGIKNRAIALAAADGHAITAANVYVLYGPQ